MLQKSKKKQIEFSLPMRLSAHQNPYLPKLTIKVANPPLLPGQSIKWLSPLSSGNQVYVGQSVPLWRNEKVRLALVWKCFVGGGGRYGRGNIGGSIQYKVYQKLKWKTTVLMGSPSSLHTVLYYPLKKGVEVAAQYSVLSNQQLFHTLSFGIYKHNLHLQIQKKIGLDTRATISNSTSTRFLPHCQIQGKITTDLNDIKGAQVQLGLSYPTVNGKVFAGVTTTPRDRQVGLKFSYERSFKQIGKIGISTYLMDSTTALYFSYKTPTLNLVFPIALMPPLVPTIVAGALFVIGYLWMRVRGKTQQNNEKQIEDNKQEEERREELKLIGDKANQIYEKERAANGLLIEESYVGPKQLLQTFLTQPNKAILLLRSPEYASIYDVTICLRFYTLKSTLKLPRGNKKNMLGFYCKREDDWLYVRYSIKGEQRESLEKLKNPLNIQ